MKEEPLLVVVGKPRSLARACAPIVVFLVLAAGFFTSSSVLLGGALIGMGTWTVLAFVGGPGVAAVVAFVADAWIRRSEGRIAFYDDRISFQIAWDRPPFGGAGPSWSEVAWGDVLSFDDGASEHVLVRAKRFDASNQLPYSFSIPTLREEDRVAVLALLDAKGVRRES
jgi:hypothetical protein